LVGHNGRTIPHSLRQTGITPDIYKLEVTELEVEDHYPEQGRNKGPKWA